jgi:AraC-like DNA-binding protein
MAWQAEQSTTVQFSTAGVPRAKRAGLLGELRERGILPIEPVADGVADVAISKWFLPGASLLSGTLSGVRQLGTPTADDSDDVFFGVNVVGESTASQAGQTITIGDGDATFVSLAEGPFSVVRAVPTRFIGLRLPRTAVAAMVPNPDDPRLRLVPRASDALSLLTNYMQAILNTQSLASPVMARTVVNHLADLVALSLGATSDAAHVARARGVKAARLQTIKADIEAKLADGPLTVIEVAARHGVTPRYIHKLFETEGTTYTQYVLRRRLDHAHRRLRDPRGATQTISSIAYDVGFTDLSYFNRTFRRHFNATPSDVRNATGEYDHPH